MNSAKIGKQNLPFYKNFWKLITYIQDVTLVQKSENDWTFTIETINLVLDMFGTNNESNCVLGPISMIDESTNKPISNGYFSTKYLTSPQLMMLEISEPYFREHILIQILIFFQTLKVSSEKSPQSSWVLTENKKETISDLEKKIKNQLGLFSTTEGRKIGNSIEHVLNRELHWVQWKKYSCKDFGKSPDSLMNESNKEVLRPAKKLKLGNEKLAQIWEWASDQPLENFSKIPTIPQFLAPVFREVDFEPQFKQCNTPLFQWKFQRLLSRYDYQSLSILHPSEKKENDDSSKKGKEEKRSFEDLAKQILSSKDIKEEVLPTQNNPSLSSSQEAKKKKKKSFNRF